MQSDSICDIILPHALSSRRFNTALNLAKTAWYLFVFAIGGHVVFSEFSRVALQVEFTHVNMLMFQEAVQLHGVTRPLFFHENAWGAS